MDMDISMDIHGKSVDMDMDMDGKYHIHGKPDLNLGRLQSSVRQASGHYSLLQRGGRVP